MKGLDSNLERNLTSTFEQDYPNFELVCSVENELDPAVKVFLKLQKQYPNVKSKLIIGIDILTRVTRCRAKSKGQQFSYRVCRGRE
jgi:ceramide glucosyltransferase